MPRTRPPYPEEFRREAVRLARMGAGIQSWRQLRDPLCPGATAARGPAGSAPAAACGLIRQPGAWTRRTGVLDRSFVASCSSARAARTPVWWSSQSQCAGRSRSRAGLAHNEDDLIDRWRIRRIAQPLVRRRGPRPVPRYCGRGSHTTGHIHESWLGHDVLQLGSARSPAAPTKPGACMMIKLPP